MARGVHRSSSSVTNPFTWGSTSRDVADLGKGSLVCRRARDDDSDNQGSDAVPTTHDTIDAISDVGTSSMDLGGN
ncbi:hypothetical protein GUJ93_ZPchr0008g11639 [Zizania palustris]|uniref:Uncharacterized protein n=1 Tax=Zizania palustris TaxID=103762 RepID=A0A8J5RHJ4_ZIZPA|nr:hypothetical protein GUJ93_ZPchr0008g11639 [Zizania palustris]